MRSSLRAVLSHWPLLLRIAVGTVFIWASVPKMRHPYAFYENVTAYGLAPAPVAAWVAVALPFAEAIVGICLIGGFWTGGALLLALGLSLSFVFVNAWAVSRGLDIGCGCMGDDGARVGPWSIVRATLLAAAVAAVCWRTLARAPRRRVQSRPVLIPSEVT